MGTIYGVIARDISAHQKSWRFYGVSSIIRTYLTRVSTTPSPTMHMWWTGGGVSESTSCRILRTYNIYIIYLLIFYGRLAKIAFRKLTSVTSHQKAYCSLTHTIYIIFILLYNHYSHYIMLWCVEYLCI